MKIAQICLTRAWGGLEMCAVQYSKLAQQRGHESYAILMEGSPAFQNINLPPENVLLLPASSYFNPLSSYKIGQFLRRNKIDAVFCHHLKDLWLLYPAFGLCSSASHSTFGHSVQLIGFSHMFISGVNKKDFLHTKIYDKLKNLVVLTEVQKSASLKCLPVPAEKYAVIPNGVDIKKFHPSKRSDEIRKNFFSAGPTETVIGMVGRLDPQKGQWEFLQAASVIAKEFSETRFVCVGQPNKDADGAAYKAKLEKGIIDFGLQNRFFLLGHHADVSALTASIDLFAVPSYEETFGLCTIEAMASGCAVVGTNAGGTPELILDNVSGFLFAPHSAEDLARVLRTYLKNPELAKQHAAKARERVEERFNIDVVFDRILALL